MGLSTDTKPTSVTSDATFLETDTNNLYRWDGLTQLWVLSTAAGGSGFTPISSDILQNKTISIDLNILKHSTTNVLGDLVKSDGTQFNRFPIGTANQILAVNSGGTDLVWTTAGTWNPTATETLQNKTMDYSLNTFLNFPFNQAITFQDYTRTTLPANPASNTGRVYVKQVDTNNDGLFIIIKKATGFVEVQIV